MSLSTAERNRRKRERKKKEREEQRQLEEAEKQRQQEEEKSDGHDVEIVFEPEPVLMGGDALPEGVPQPADDDGLESVMRRFQERAAVVTDDEQKQPKDERVKGDDEDSGSDDDDDDDEKERISKRKLREMLRPSVADLKRRVKRPDLVEAHDVTSLDPDFLIELKSVPGTVPIPRHWGRKRKYLQGKRGFEKQPFQLPDFILKTGVAELRDQVSEAEAAKSAKQKNRGRVAPKMGAIDIDYKTLHDAFFKHQSKPSNLTKLGDLYYEGKELETQTNIRPGGPFSDALREALGMVSETMPPPWLNNMQRFGPPPGYPSLRIPGLNAPLPNDQCQYGYHPGGWGKPPVDAYGRPLYGGNPFDPPGSGAKDEATDGKYVTSHGKTLGKVLWGALPEAGYDEARGEESEEESSDEEMEESESEEEGEETTTDGIESALPPPPGIAASTGPLDLRKQPGDETPMINEQPKQLYHVVPQAQAKAEDQEGAVFASSMKYAVPVPTPAETPDGAASVLSKALPAEGAKRKRKDGDDEEEGLGKNFKF